MKIQILTLMFLAGILHWSGAADIYDAPAAEKQDSPLQFNTLVELLAATRNGEVPGRLSGQIQLSDQDAVGKSIIRIIEKEHGITIKPRHDTASLCGLLVQNVTAYELSGQKDERSASSFKHNRQFLVLPDSPGFITALDVIIKDYARAVRDSISLGQDAEQRMRINETLKQSKADMEQRIQQAERRAKVESEVAKAASQMAEDRAREEAVKQAIAKMQAEKKAKLAEVLASKPYKLWTAAINVEEGLSMVRSAREVLAHDDQVSRASGVSDLAARRKAGERIVAGNTMIAESFAEYRKLGGTASKPEDVKAGPDPAAEFR